MDSSRLYERVEGLNDSGFLQSFAVNCVKSHNFISFEVFVYFFGV